MASTDVRVDLRSIAADCAVTLTDVADCIGMSRQLLTQVYLEGDLTEAETLKIARAILAITSYRRDMAVEALITLRSESCEHVRN